MPSLESAPGLNPEAVFRAFGGRAGLFFLDSSLGCGGLGAWSFLGFDPFLTVRAFGERLELTWRDGRTEARRGDPLIELRRLLDGFRSASAAVPFAGGAVGYFSYEWGARRHGVGGRRGQTGPGFEFAFYDGLLARNLESGEGLLVANPVYHDPPGRIFSRLRRALEGAMAAPLAPAPKWRAPAQGEIGESMPREAYLRTVGRIREYIAAGDVYQINLTQRFDAPPPAAAHVVYPRLRRLSPAPFGAYLDIGGLQILSSSPERFLRVAGRRAETRPIKGTRRRGRFPEEDRRFAEALQASAKDRAELLMIVDLERNDLGRVSEFGSVAVEENFVLETHPTVHHLVAQVSGRLRPEADALDGVEALFPGGSISGAPKVRALQIIDELESCPRGVYTGAVGYLGFDGNCDLNIAIRTLIFQGGRVHFHAGGGVVWDSEPEAEYEEMKLKAAALRAALAGEGEGA